MYLTFVSDLKVWHCMDKERCLLVTCLVNLGMLMILSSHSIV